MKEETAEEAVQVETEPKIGPGRDLRAAREIRNLSQEAVAKQLHIDISLVRALEEDDYAKFAAPIFITGHLRAYARLLGVAPEPFIAAYQGLGMASAPSLERVAHLSEQPESIAKAQVPRWLIYVLAASVVAVVVLIWRSEATKLLTPIMESPLMSDATAPGAGGAATSTLPVPAIGKTPQQTPSSTAGAQPSGVGASGAANAAANQALPAGPKARLDLAADKPSWVEVKDRSGNRLFYDLMVPGDTKSIEGVPPFDLLLGYAPGVTVKYNGKLVDHSAYSRQGMARFRVGDTGVSKH